MAKSNKNEKYAYLDRLSTARLEELLRADIESPENGNDGVIFHILEVMEEREDGCLNSRLPDADKAWAEFQQYYNIPEGEGLSLYPIENESGEEAPAGEEEEGPASRWPQRTKRNRPSRMLRAAGIAAVVAVCTVGLMVGVQAAGIDIFGAIGRWTEETFHFVTAPVGAMQDDVNAGISSMQRNSEYYHRLQNALDECGITEKLAPTWYPEGFEMSEPKTANNELGNKVLCGFTGPQDKSFSIQVRRYNSASYLDVQTLEKDNEDVEEYIIGGKIFYIMSNMDATTATWSDGSSLVLSIVGNIPKAKIKDLLDSIGG